MLWEETTKCVVLWGVFFLQRPHVRHAIFLFPHYLLTPPPMCCLVTQYQQRLPLSPEWREIQADF